MDGLDWMDLTLGLPTFILLKWAVQLDCPYSEGVDKRLNWLVMGLPIFIFGEVGIPMRLSRPTFFFSSSGQSSPMELYKVKKKAENHALSEY